MEINLKDTLRKLRRQKNVTQEALANHLDITPQSVGKWERGEGYPDITLLPKIALYFDVTVDELLGVDKARIEETINAYLEEDKQYGFDGDTKRELELWEKAYKEFPNDIRVMVKLMYALGDDKDDVPLPEDKLNRIVELGETILATSTDREYRESAIQCLCFAYRDVDEEKALHYADMGGDFITNRVNLRCRVLSDEKGVEACQEYLRDLIEVAANTAAAIPNKKRLSYEEMIEAYTFGIDLYKRLYSDGNLGFYNCRVAYNYYCLAYVHAEFQNTEKVLEMLKECCRYTFEFDRVHDQDFDYTALLMNRTHQKKEDVSKNYTGNAANLRLHVIEDREVFDYLRDDVRFQQILDELREHAVE